LRALAGLDHPADALFARDLGKGEADNVGGMRRGDDEDAVEIADDDIARPDLRAVRKLDRAAEIGSDAMPSLTRSSCA